jgi:Tfp pilus assembly protein PilN
VSCGLPLLLTLAEEEKITFDFDIARRNDKIEQFGRAEQSAEKAYWRNQYWRKEEMLALGLAKQIKNPTPEYLKHGDEYCSEGKENFSQFNQFKIYGISVVSAILLGLIVNYFYQNHLNQRVAQLEDDLSIHNENLAMLDRLNQEKMRKEKVVMSAGVTSNHFLAFYMDEIGKSVPKNIRLSEMKVFPVAGKLKNKQKVEVEKDQISIIGVTKGNVVLDDWIEAMNRFDWVQSVELLNYLKDGEDIAEFELIMTLE